jgi:hypothetical protein
LRFLTDRRQAEVEADQTTVAKPSGDHIPLGGFIFRLTVEPFQWPPDAKLLPGHDPVGTSKPPQG